MSITSDSFPLFYSSNKPHPESFSLFYSFIVQTPSDSFPVATVSLNGENVMSYLKVCLFRLHPHQLCNNHFPIL